MGIASQIVGEYREVDREDMNRDSHYRLGDYIGKSGVEAQYESDLRGKPGIRQHLVDVRNNVRSTLSENDSLPVTGADVTLTLDADLQATPIVDGGQARAPSWPSSLPRERSCRSFRRPPTTATCLTGTSRGAAYDSLAKHPWKPLYNRAIRGTYRPGSIFKMVQG